MRNVLEHLPQHKQKELGIIKNIILEKVPDVRMIILFGSYARGGWVEEDIQIENGAVHVYLSDYDILVATKTEEQAESFNLHDSISQAIERTGKVSTPVNIIYHTLEEINRWILEGQYFFTDIKKEGIHLYKTGKNSLAKIKTIPLEERKIIAQEHYDKWFKKAKGAYRQFEHALNDCDYKWAAFMLHQTTESLYSVITLVFVNYRYRLHNVEILGHKAVSYDEKFVMAFPMEKQEERDNFELLKRAYVDARYKDSYEITEKQLQYLADRVRVLMELTESICQEKIESFV